ncbi:MAG: chlorophyll synthase ChlG [Pseudomonadota bacterium]
MSAPSAYSPNRPARRVPDLSSSLELLKPITWFAPMWAFACGAVSSGVSWRGNWELILAGIILAGPMVCAASQAVNDWFDRHVDAINEPNRPIPSGRVPGLWGLIIAVFWTVMSLALGAALGLWAFVATGVAVLLAWAYSAPPVRLKLNGWYGNAAVAVSYEGIAWFTGAAVLLQDLPGTPIIVLAALYSVGAHGIMTLNDFKALEGDSRLGVRTLPIQLGTDRAAQLACVVMAVPQFVVVGYLAYLGAPYHAAFIVVLIAAQLWLMRTLLEAPITKAPWYNSTGTTLYVIGMLISAFAVRSIGLGGAP